MARIAGITTQKNTKGEITHVTIDLKKRKDVIPLLEELGVMEKSPFMQEFEKGITIEESRRRTHEFIKSLKWPK